MGQLTGLTARKEDLRVNLKHHDCNTAEWDSRDANQFPCNVVPIPHGVCAFLHYYIPFAAADYTGYTRQPHPDKVKKVSKSNWMWM